MFTVKSTSRDGVKRNLNLIAFRRSDEIQSTPAANHVMEAPARRVAQDEPILLWGVLGVFFLALVLAYPFVMALMGDPHGLRYVIRLAVTLVIVAGMGAIGAVFTWSRDGNVRRPG